MGSRVHLFLAVVLFQGNPWSDGGSPSRVCAGSVVGRAFSNGGAQSWDKYRERAKRFQGSVSITYLSLLPAREVRSRIRLEFKQRDGCALMHEQRTREKPEKGENDNLFCINSRYAFSLNRKTSTGGWVIWRLSTRSKERAIFHDPPDVSVQRWSTFAIYFGLASTLPFGPPGTEFSIERVSSESHEGRDLVKVEFKYTAPDDKPRLPSLVGWASYDPNRYWVLTAYDVQRTWSGTGLKGLNAGTYEYQDTRDGCPILKRIVTRGRNIRPDGTYDLEEIYDFDIREGDVPESDFTLSAFGLPEPKGMAIPRSSRWYLWFIAGGVGCLLVGFLIWRRRQPKSSSRPPLGGPAMRS